MPFGIVALGLSARLACMRSILILIRCTSGHACGNIQSSLVELEIAESPALAKRGRFDRKYCPHCEESVSMKTFKYHRRLYFNKVS